MVVRIIQSEPRFMKLVRATPTLAIWGAATATALALFGSDVPLARKDILSKIPIVGAYFPVENVKKNQEEE